MFTITLPGRASEDIQQTQRTTMESSDVKGQVNDLDKRVLWARNGQALCFSQLVLLLPSHFSNEHGKVILPVSQAKSLVVIHESFLSLPSHSQSVPKFCQFCVQNVFQMQLHFPIASLVQAAIISLISSHLYDHMAF